MAPPEQVTTRTEVEEDTWDSDGTWTHSTSAASSTVRWHAFRWLPPLGPTTLPTRRAHAGAREQAQTGRVDKSLVVAVTDTVRLRAPQQPPRAARRDAESTGPQARRSGARCGRQPPARDACPA